MPRKLKSSALRSDAVTVANIPNGEITAAKLHTTAIQDKLGYTPVSPTDLSNLIDSAPTALNTLNELAAALGDDANYAATVTTALATKASTSYVDTQISSIQVTPTQVSDKANSSTGYLALPIGSTAQRPASPTSGMVRMNSTTGAPEWYHTPTSAWVAFNATPVLQAPLVLVAGGGSGGQISNGGQSNRGAGGGAGGYIHIPTYTLYFGITYTIIVGAGGAGNSGTTTANGANSSISATINGVARTLTALGGGSGGYSDNTNNAQAGGSGGGQWYPGYTGQSATQPSTTSDGVVNYAGTGFGNKGGDSGGGQPYGSGGGGAGGAGGNFNSGSGGFGGVGKVNPITGSTSGQNVSGTYYLAGGGSSDGFSGTFGGYGGYGGGGTGNNSTYSTGANGSTNTGGGGGSGGSGGSGIFIISIPTALYSGATTGSPTVTTSGSNTILAFTSSGTYTV
jgi:hypothetical protein